MNLIDVAKQFNSEESCLAYLEQMRWPAGLACLSCGSVKVSRIKSKGKTGKVRHLYQCLEKECRHQFTATTGTIFHDTHLPLQKWFLAISLICESKKGISANQIKRALGVQYKTAWHLCHRIRKAMEVEDTDQLSGIVEVDETYVGGRYDKRRKRGRYEKVPVVGLIERNGRVRAETVPVASKITLVGAINRHVAPEAELVITDENPSYVSVRKTHRHAVINHIKTYVQGRIYTNTIENFWSLLKRGIIGSFHKVSAKHLPRYLAEFTFRFNNRGEENLFGMTVKNLVESINLKYSELTSEGSE